MLSGSRTALTEEPSVKPLKVEDRIVKAPLIVTKEDDPKLPNKDPGHVTRENVAEKYGYWIRAAVQRWQEHRKAYKGRFMRDPPLGLAATIWAPHPTLLCLDASSSD